MNSPLRFVGGLLIEVGSIVLALMLLPVVPWEHWKSIVSPAPQPVVDTLPAFIPEARYAFQLNGEPRRLEERSFTLPRESQPAPTQSAQEVAPPRQFIPPQILSETPRSAAQPRHLNDRAGVDVPRNPLPSTVPSNDSYYAQRPLAPSESQPQRNESLAPPSLAPPPSNAYVAETLDRASRKMLDAFAAPFQSSPPVPPLEPAATQSFARPIAPPASNLPPTAPAAPLPQIAPLPNLPNSYPQSVPQSPQPSGRFQPMLDQLQTAPAAPITPPAWQPRLPNSELRRNLPRSIHY